MDNQENKVNTGKRTRAGAHAHSTNAVKRRSPLRPILTFVIIVLGVLLITPLTPILNAPVLEPAFAQILPALFGGLGVVFISKNWKIAVAPIVLMLILFIFVPALNAGTVGIMVPVSAIFTIITARIMYKKGML